MKIKTEKTDEYGMTARQGFLRANASRVLTALLVVALVFVPVFTNIMMLKEAEAVSRACRNSAECMAAVAKEEEANRNAASAAQSVSLFQARINEMNYEIAAMELDIAETEAQVDSLVRQIEEAEEKLRAEQEALVSVLVNMHFEGDTEPITILAGSSSISDLAEKQARAEVVRQQISATANKIKETKAKLEEDKSAVEALLEQQQSAKARLVERRAEQQALVNKYQNDVAAYAAVAEAAKLAQREAERKEQEEHPERYSGSVYYGVNTYPWQKNCPKEQDDYGTVWNGRYIGGYVCECVSYAGWKAYEAYGIVIAWGNAYSWDDRARVLGYRVDHTPEPDSIGQNDDGPYGHVFWVESVNYDGSIDITEYNNYWSTGQLTGSYHMGDFGSRTISASQVKNYNFIHLK